MRKPTIRDRIFQGWFRASRSLTLGVRGVVTDSAERVLLVRHTYTPGWHLPGGGVEKGETGAGAMLKELREEAGIRAEAHDLDLLSIHANHAFFPNDHVLVYRVVRWSQGTATSRNEIAETRFADPLAPPEGATPGTLRRLRELFAGAPRSESW